MSSRADEIGADHAPTDITRFFRADETRTAPADRVAVSVEGDRATGPITTGAADVIVDWAGVEYISSGGLRALMVAMKQKPANRRIAVVGLHAVVQEIFMIARFDPVVPIFATSEEVALAWGRPSQPE